MQVSLREDEDDDDNGWEDGGRWPSWLSVRVGGKLNGHGGIVHGGVLSLLFDKAMGWAYECLRLRDGETPDQQSVAAHDGESRHRVFSRLVSCHNKPE
jgi:hypothetical protein